MPGRQPLQKSVSLEWVGRRVVEQDEYKLEHGLALALFGYDSAFTSPLVSLPLFVERYQGPGPNGTLVFTVR